MPYKTEITIPINTPAISPTTVTWRLSHGIIRRWWILFRPGNPELAQIQVWHRLNQLIPRSPDEWLSFDSYVMEIPDYYRLFTSPFELTVKGFNLDNAFPHTVVLHAQVLPPLRASPDSFLQRLFRPAPAETEI